MGRRDFWKGHLKLSLVTCSVALVPVAERDQGVVCDPDGDSSIDIDLFAPRDSIDWIWFDTPYFLVPDDRAGEEAFAVIREAMKASDAVGIARLVLDGQERAVMLDPRGKAIMLWTLRHGDQVRDPADYFQALDAGRPEPATRHLLEAVIRQEREETVGNSVQDKLLSMIERRRKAIFSHRQRRKAEPRGDNVVDITDAVRRSAVK